MWKKCAVIQKKCNVTSMIKKFVFERNLTKHKKILHIRICLLNVTNVEESVHVYLICFVTNKHV